MKVKAFIANTPAEKLECIVCKKEANIKARMNEYCELCLCNGCARKLGEKLVDAAKRRPKKKVKL